MYSAAARDLTMRKRHYVQCSDQKVVADHLTENIELWQAKRRKLAAPGVPAIAEAIDETPVASIHNLVGTARIDMCGAALDLPSVSKHMPNAHFDRQKFAAITIRLQQPFCTVLLFGSGKMVLTGCKTFLQCLCAAHEIASFLRGAYPQHTVRLCGVTIQNIVGNADLGLRPDQSIDLDSFMEDLNVYCTYLKHMFPGLIFRPPNSPVVLLLFLSGKVVITGGKSSHDVEHGWRTLWPTVRKYIRTTKNI